MYILHIEHTICAWSKFLSIVFKDITYKIVGFHVESTMLNLLVVVHLLCGQYVLPNKVVRWLSLVVSVITVNRVIWFYKIVQNLQKMQAFYIDEKPSPALCLVLAAMWLRVLIRWLLGIIWRQVSSGSATRTWLCLYCWILKLHRFNQPSPWLLRLHIWHFKHLLLPAQLEDLASHLFAVAAVVTTIASSTASLQIGTLPYKIVLRLAQLFIVWSWLSPSPAWRDQNRHSGQHQQSLNWHTHSNVQSLRDGCLIIDWLACPHLV